jgi:hypothetical protein
MLAAHLNADQTSAGVSDAANTNLAGGPRHVLLLASIACVVHVAQHCVIFADAGVAMQPTRAMGSGLTEQFPQAQNMSDFPAAAHDLLGLDGLLTTEERCTRDAVRQFMVRACGNRGCLHVDAQ